jgi:hypothetical protein
MKYNFVKGLKLPLSAIGNVSACPFRLFIFLRLVKEYDRMTWSGLRIAHVSSTGHILSPGEAI